MGGSGGSRAHRAPSPKPGDSEATATPPAKASEATPTVPPPPPVDADTKPPPATHQKAPPSRPSQSLLASALRETPSFVKHEAIQTTPSKSKTRSAFAVIRTEEHPEGDTKKDEDAATGHHHHCHHHHHRNMCWAAYHHCRHQHESKEDKKESTCAGFFINASKDDWGGLLKEAWSRIKNMIESSGGTILLDHGPEHKNKLGEGVGLASWNCGHQRTEYSGTQGCIHAHKCCPHHKAADVHQPHRYSGHSPNHFYDCFECQVSHQY